MYSLDFIGLDDFRFEICFLKCRRLATLLRPSRARSSFSMSLCRMLQGLDVIVIAVLNVVDRSPNKSIFKKNKSCYLVFLGIFV